LIRYPNTRSFPSGEDVRRRTEATTSIALILLAACGRDAPDVRVPLGARAPGVSHPVLATRSAHTVPSTTASLPPASYSAEQAARGAQTYAATCARCHPPGQLDGQAFAIAWNEARVSTLYNTIRNTMPQDKPGSLTDQEYVDVIAYLLQRSKVPPGAAPLAPDSAALRQVRIAVAPAR
jgi:mono/diheme cytochrome c family protein